MTARQQMKNSIIRISNRRRILMVILIIGILASVFSINQYVSAYNEKQGVVCGDDVNVRSGPGTNNAVLIFENSNVRLNTGHNVTIKGEYYDSSGHLWYNISFSYGTAGTIEGYMYGDFITPIESDYSPDEDFEAYMTAQGFPESYKPSLRILHQKYPNWVFKADKINLEWASVVDGQSVVGRSLIALNSIASWKSTAAGAYNWQTNQWVGFDSGAWAAASKELVAYYLDPRNFLDETSIFQFESLSYQPANHSIAGVNTIVAGTFMDASIGVEGTTYPAMLMSAAQSSTVSPLYLASSIIQEQGRAGTSQLISGTYPGFTGIYNYFNYGAYSSNGSATEVIVNGLTFAKNQGWNSRQKSITGGATRFGQGYIAIGQDTLYYKKFDFVNKLYDHQYMTHIRAAALEASTMSKAYTAEMKNTVSLTFKIPVYNNMPTTAAVLPTSNANPNNYLSGLTVSGCTLTPSFNTNTTKYDITVANNVTSVNISATPVASTSTITGTGNKALVVGRNDVNVVVKSQSGSDRTYTITIIRQEPTSNNENIGGNASVKIDYTLTKTGTTNIISGVSPGTTVEQAKSKFTTTNCIVRFYDSAGNSTTGTLGTGSMVKVFDTAGTTLLATYQMLIYGDVNGDGVINTSDILALRRDLFEYVKLSGLFKNAADINRDGISANTSDILAARRHVFGYVNIQQ